MNGRRRNKRAHYMTYTESVIWDACVTYSYNCAYVTLVLCDIVVIVVIGALPLR